ncbi:hypothetical protein D3C73_1346020 [compost metagenome]
MCRRHREQARSHTDFVEPKRGSSVHKKGLHLQAFFVHRTVLRLVRPGQEFVGLHFQQSAEGTLEFEIQAPAGVEIL